MKYFVVGFTQTQVAMGTELKIINFAKDVVRSKMPNGLTGVLFIQMNR